MARPTSSLITAEEFYRLPDDNCVTELIRGRLVSEPLPFRRHGKVAARIAGLLQNWADETGAGEVVTCDTGFVLERNPDTVRGPDVAFVDAARCEQMPEGPYFEGAPTLAVEVLSPGNRQKVMAAKVAEYFAAGAGMVWLVDPEPETVTVHDGQATIVLGRGDRLTAPTLMPGFDVEVGELFT